MTDNVFVDTNVLVYTRDASEDFKQNRAMAWMNRLWTERTGRLSFQVLNEFYVTVTQKLHPGMDRQSARKDIRYLLAWHPTPVGANVVEGAWQVQDRYRLSWWDALIVSAARITNCRYLLTEDLAEEQDFGDLVVINPFSVLPESISKE